MSDNAKNFLLMLFHTVCNSVLAWVIISVYESLRGAWDLSSNMVLFCIVIGAFLTFVQSDN